MAAKKKLSGGAVGKKAVNNGKAPARTPVGAVAKPLELNKLQAFGIDGVTTVATKKAMTTK